MIVAMAAIGAVFILLDGGRGAGFTNKERNLDSADVKVIGAAAGDYAGSAVAGGDFNGDGIDDLLIGAPTATDKGKAYIIFGAQNLAGIKDLAGGAGFTVLGTEGGLGQSVAAGDFNNDGIDDLVLGAPGSDSDRGQVYVIYGEQGLSGVFDLSVTSARLRVIGPTQYAGLGASVATGDFNGDGNDDLVMGAPQADGKGAAYVLYGPWGSGSVDSLPLDEYSFKIMGADVGDTLGRSLATGDFNGDGKDGIVVGAPQAYGYANDRSNSGEVFVIDGPANWNHLVFNTGTDIAYLRVVAGTEEFLGQSVAAGDFNNDGHDDVLMGAPAYGFAGDAYVIYQASNWGVSDMTLGEYNLKVVGDPGRSSLGGSAAAGDFNADGEDDLLIGATGPGKGTAYAIFHASNWGVSALALGEYDLRAVGNDVSDSAGSSLAAGDFNGDGVADVLIGAPSAAGINNTRPQAGEVYVIFGTKTATPTPTATPSPTAQPSESATPTTSAVALVQGDIDCSGGVVPLDSLKLILGKLGLQYDHAPACPEVGAAVPAAVTASALFGDVDCINGVDMDDALAILRNFAGLPYRHANSCPGIGEPI